MELDLIPEHILEALDKRGLSTKDILNSTPEKLFKEYIEWYGLICWDKKLIGAIDSLRYAKKAK